MRNIYILLTCTGTVFSRVIKYFTRRKYTHASIALDSSGQHFFSFARKQVFPPLPAGFVKENINEGIFARYSNCRCAMYQLTVNEITYNKIAAQLAFMHQYESTFQYNCLGPICCFFKIPYHSSQKYFCSEFVADILEQNGAMKFEKHTSLIHPSDFTRINELKLIYEGTLNNMKEHLHHIQAETAKPSLNNVPPIFKAAGSR